MPAVTETRAPTGAPDVHPGLRLTPLLTWILIQLAALALGASAIPIWAHHPAPRESLAAQELIAIQIAASAMLFPILLPNFSTTIAITFLAWPFLHLAGMLSLTPEANLLRACLYLSLWIIGLRTCAASLHSTNAILLGICLAESFTLGGAILWYLHLESASASASPELFGPLIGAVLQIGKWNPSWIAWTEAALPLLIGGVLHLGKKKITHFD
jgi:hypothetical protein